MSEPLAQRQYPYGVRILSYCPLSACSWQHEDGPLPEGSGASVDEAVTSILTEHFAALEEIVQAHLETHSLLEWVQEVMRLREHAAGAVTVSRDDLAAVYGYARHFDVGSDTSMLRIRFALGLPGPGMMERMCETAESYTCASCGGAFTKGRSDEEAMAEARSLLPADQLSDPGGLAVICDPRWLGIMGRVQVEAPEMLAPGAALVPGACYRTSGGLPVHVTNACRCPR
jgi:hypothetical protein